mmetsp:Transcript_22785/g.36588  ORF Transcript_22785/g.36588 Transcript_22785/m.36588 type:complete len:454 (+) Transcript_22785:116-1477(+)
MASSSYKRMGSMDNENGEEEKSRSFKMSSYAMSKDDLGSSSQSGENNIIEISVEEKLKKLKEDPLFLEMLDKIIEERLRVGEQKGAILDDAPLSSNFPTLYSFSYYRTKLLSHFWLDTKLEWFLAVSAVSILLAIGITVAVTLSRDVGQTALTYSFKQLKAGDNFEKFSVFLAQGKYNTLLGGGECPVPYVARTYFANTESGVNYSTPLDYTEYKIPSAAAVNQTLRVWQLQVFEGNGLKGFPSTILPKEAEQVHYPSEVIGTVIFKNFTLQDSYITGSFQASYPCYMFSVFLRTDDSDFVESLHELSLYEYSIVPMYGYSYLLHLRSKTEFGKVKHEGTFNPVAQFPGPLYGKVTGSGEYNRSQNAVVVAYSYLPKSINGIGSSVVYDVVSYLKDCASLLNFGFFVFSFIFTTTVTVPLYFIFGQRGRKIARMTQQGLVSDGAKPDISSGSM